MWCDLCKEMPQLFESIQVIYGQPLRVLTKREELKANFKWSVRGSIRQSPNVITWIVSLTNLREDWGTADAAAVIKDWNKDSSESEKLVGGKAAGPEAHHNHRSPLVLGSALASQGIRSPVETLGFLQTDPAGTKTTRHL
jgi:hypothetical protein